MATATFAVERYLLDELTPEQREEFEDHFFECPECAQAVRTATEFTVNGGALTKGQTRPFADEKPATNVTEMPSRSAPRRWPKWLNSIPTIAASILLPFVGYQNLVLIPELRLPQVTESLILRADARGAVPELKRGKAVVGVKLELNDEHPKPFYRVDLIHDGKIWTTLEKAPAVANQIEIAIPPGYPAGNYEMLVRDSSSAAEVARFPFLAD